MAGDNHNLNWIDPKTINFYKPLINDYLDQKASVQHLQAFSPTLEGIKKAVSRRTFGTEIRSLLVEVLKEQNSLASTHPSVLENIDKLAKENCFTICTAHQPLLMGGPLYFLYKILSAISLCKKLNEDISDKQFVPVLWLGSEDHDFDEMGNFNFFGENIQWPIESKGPAGRLSQSKLESVIGQIREKFSNEVPSLLEEIIQVYTSQNSFSEAVSAIVNHTLGKYGVIILNPDDARFKRVFASIMKSELESSNSGEILQANTTFLEEHYHAQAHVREINLFHQTDDLRQRIERVEGGFRFAQSKEEISEERLFQELDMHPERYSPNVILRPLYQEIILPNIATIGGGGESAYWLMLKPLFEHHNVAFPVVLLRDSAFLMPGQRAKKLANLNLKLEDLSASEVDLVKKTLENNDVSIEDLSEYKAKVQQLFVEIADRAKTVDPTLSKVAMAESTKAAKSIDHVEKKINASIKRGEEQRLDQVRKLQSFFWPKGIPQERHDSWLQWVATNGTDWIDELLTHFNPLDAKILVKTLEKKVSK